MTIKSAFIPSIHAFRGFAILNIVAVHAFAFILFYAGMGSDNPKPVVKALYNGSETLFHGSTLYFTLISGMLFSIILAKKGWKAFFRSKLSYVAVPYLFMSCLFTLSHWGQGSEKTWFDGSVFDFLKQLSTYLVTGNAIFTFWYIPVLLVLYLLTPAISWLTELKHGRWGVLVLALLPLVFSRVWPGISWTTYVYFIGAYTLGIFVGQHYQQTLVFISKHLILFLISAIATTCILATFYSLDIKKWGPISLRESMFYIQKLAIAGLTLLAFEKFLKQVPAWLNTLANYAFPIYFIHAYLLFEIYKQLKKYEPDLSNPLVTVIFCLLNFIAVILCCVIITVAAKFVLRRYSRYFIGA